MIKLWKDKLLRKNPVGLEGGALWGFFLSKAVYSEHRGRNVWNALHYRADSLFSQVLWAVKGIGTP